MHINDREQEFVFLMLPCKAVSKIRCLVKIYCTNTGAAKNRQDCYFFSRKKEILIFRMKKFPAQWLSTHNSPRCGSNKKSHLAHRGGIMTAFYRFNPDQITRAHSLCDVRLIFMIIPRGFWGSKCTADLVTLDSNW